MYANPVWKSVEKAKWKNPRGMSYEGQLCNHVLTHRSSLMGGSGLQRAAIDASKAKTGRGGSWQVIDNQDKEGSNPYAGGYPNIAATAV